MEDTEKLASSLGSFTVRDVTLVQELAQEELSGRNFFLKLIESKLAAKDISVEGMDNWTDDILLQVVIGWLTRSKVVHESSDDTVTLENLQAVLLERARRFRERSQQIAASSEREFVRQSNKVQEALRSLQRPDEQILRSFALQAKSYEDAIKFLTVSGVITPPPESLFDKNVIASVIEATRIRSDELIRMQTLLSATSVARSPLLDAALLSAQSASSIIGEQLKSVTRYAEALAVKPSLKLIDEHIKPMGELLRAVEMATSAQASLSRLSMDRLGAAVELSNRYQQSLAARLADVTSAYADHVRSVKVPPGEINSVSLVLVESPAREIYTTTEFVEIISVESVEDDVAEMRRKQRTEFALENDDVLHNLLSEVEPGLIVMLEGATQALVSTNVDRVRHFAVSLRELFTHIIHTFAPDKEVKAWTSDPQHFVNNNPTRKARLLYICRGINHPPLDKFFRKDIEATLELLDVFQEGTHSVEVQLGIEQTEVLKLRMESAIRFILEVNRYNQ